MNLTHAQAHESYFGPPSELIDVGAFIQLAYEVQERPEEATRPRTNSHLSNALPEDVEALWTSLSAEERGNIEAECWYVVNIPLSLRVCLISPLRIA